MSARARRDALIAAVREDLSRGTRRTALLAGAERARDLLALAASHRVGGWMLEAVRDCPEFGGIPEDYLVEHARAAAVHVHIRSTLARLAPRFDDAGISWAVVKGPVLAQAVYSRSAMRTYTDLDLLVSRRDFATAVEMLADHGFEELSTNWALFEREGFGEVPLGSDMTVVDLHWSLIGTSAARGGFAVATDPMLDRVRRIRIDGRSVPTLDQADTLLHLVLHAGLAGANRLVWLKDIDQAIRNTDLDWDEVMRRAEAYHMRTMTSVVLARTSRVLGTPVSLPRPTLALPTRALDRLPRSELALHDGLYSGVWIASLRDGAGHSLRAGGRSVSRAMAKRVPFGGAVATRRPDQLDPANRRGWAHASGGSLARQRYLANVAAARYGP